MMGHGNPVTGVMFLGGPGSTTALFEMRKELCSQYIAGYGEMPKLRDGSCTNRQFPFRNQGGDEK